MNTFFAHQSVGANILTGIADLVRQQRAAVDVLDLTQARGVRSAQPLLIIHQQIGANREPLGKIAAFRQVLNATDRPDFDVALLKFCYVDIATQADAETLWQHYQTAIEQLSADQPGVQLVHCTVPLRSLPEGPYAWLRRALGHRHPSLIGNRARDWFNRQLRASFGAGHKLFDLAAVQSRRADGRSCEVNDEGTRVPSLAREWTYDGGHLNERGRTIAAAAFLEFLQTLQDSRKR
ncbi:SGNH/GDSL hydrolase family protein [Peristeroidobacter soli]|jgi:hypothetical protein|uniref:hypothetical protein n=1 Tax=Peristeroidobacter soli TaxID=2497877 RepID=UPI00101C3F81|nr:hypothetical protein [Peristeroidobacter soli]